MLQYNSIQFLLNTLSPESMTVDHVPGQLAAQGHGQDVGEGLEERDHPDARP